MADQRITQLTALPEASLAAADVLPIADISASETKKITAKDLVEGGIALADSGSIDLIKLNQSSTTKLGATALATGAVTAVKLANNSSISVGVFAPVADNFDGRGYYDSSTGVLQVYSAGSYANVAAIVGTEAVDTAQLADGAVTTAKINAAGLAAAALASDSVTTAKIIDSAVTSSKLAAEAVNETALGSASVTSSKIASGAVIYNAIQATTTTDVVLGRSSAGGGTVEEITLTAAGRALIDDVDAAAQRTTLGLGALAIATGSWTNGSSFAGTTTGTNTGDQTITLTGDVTGTGTGSFATSISTDAITETKILANAVTTGKINAAAVTAVKLADNSGVIVAADVPSGSGAFIGQQWVNTNTGFEYTWTGSEWQRLHGLATLAFPETTPLAFAVSYPDNFSAQIDVTLDTQAASQVLIGPASGADAAPTFRAIAPGDLPNATASTKGVIQPGTGLAVTTGTLNHSNTITGATVSNITFDNQGHITAAAALTAGSIPNLDASKITTGTFATALLGDDAVTGAKLADYATAKIGEALPTADYIGQLFFNPLDKNVYLWDGNVWQPVGVSIGELIFAGTYDASVNEILSTTTVGAAAGLVVGDPLPTASSTFVSYYVVVSDSGTGTAPAPTVALAPPDIILCDGTAWQEIDVSSTYTAQTASNVGFVPAGTISSTNVQTAVEEVAAEAANAANLTSGVVAVARGGTALGSYAKGDLLAASAATTLTKLGVGTNGQVLKANSATATGLEWGASTSGTVTDVTSSTGALTVATSTTTPALTIRSATTSVDGIVQLSDSISTTSSTVAATATAVKTAYDLANAALPKAGGVITGALEIGSTGSLVFEGATDDTFETTLAVADATADRTLTLPNSTGTLVSTGDTGTVTSTMILNGTIVDADINASAAIVDTKLATIATAGKVSNSATTATSANTLSAIVARDGSGNFTAGTITTTGRVLTGTSTALTNVYAIGTALTPAVQIESSTGDGAALSITHHSSAAANLLLQRGVTGTPVADTEALGQVGFNGFDGTNYFNAALIRAVVDGTPSPGSMPGRLSLQTTPSGSTTPVERLRLTPVGRVQITGAYDTNTTAVSALNIDCSTGNYFTKTINGASTFTVSNVPANRAYAFTLELTHTSGTITWFSGVEWPSGTAPTLTTGKTHLFMFVTDDGGTRWRGAALVNYTN